MTQRLVCRECHRVLDVDEGGQCPVCGSNSLTEDWAGYVVIAHPDESDIAREMDVEDSGQYALKVR
jgi:DNA-directed RNA polymerase subunit E"